MESYFYPLNEKVRLILRTNQLFKLIEQTANLNNQMSGYQDQSFHNESFNHTQPYYLALECLVNLLNIGIRYNFNAEFGKELERVNLVLNDLALTEQLKDFYTFSYKELYEDDFLAYLRQKIMLSGTTYNVDHYRLKFWLSDKTKCESDLIRWLVVLRPYIIMNRMIMKAYEKIAIERVISFEKGFCQLNLLKNTCLLKLFIPENSHFFPEFSGNQHRMTVRLLNQSSGQERPKQLSIDHQLRLTCCII